MTVMFPRDFVNGTHTAGYFIQDGSNSAMVRQLQSVQFFAVAWGERSLLMPYIRYLPMQTSSGTEAGVHGRAS